jgi:hypothetical protein
MFPVCFEVAGDGGAVQGAERALPAHHRHPVASGRQGERRHHLLHRQEHQGLEPRLYLRGRGNKYKYFKKFLKNRI